MCALFHENRLNIKKSVISFAYLFCRNTGTKFHEPYHSNHMIPHHDFGDILKMCMWFFDEDKFFLPEKQPFELRQLDNFLHYTYGVCLISFSHSFQWTFSNLLVQGPVVQSIVSLTSSLRVLTSLLSVLRLYNQIH